jgi:predicted aminopeptidase
MYRNEEPVKVILDSKGKQFAFSTLVSWVLFGFIGLGLYGCPKYNVWQQDLEGQAELARAEQNRKITVAEAQAKMDAAKSLAQAEVERAKGVAEANKIIGDSLNGNESYLRYLFIDKLGQGDTIYIPTEAGLPILEAGKRKAKPTLQD